MEKSKRHIVVVCGYGCHLKDPSGGDTPLKPYLDKVAGYMNTRQPELAVFCGGHTQNKTAPGVSEARLMVDYVADEFRHCAQTFLGKVRLDATSYTTLENIRNAATAIRNWGFHHARGEKVRVTIFCEAHRAPNVVMLARHFMRDLVDDIGDISVETASWERADPFKQAWNLFYNRMAIKHPWLGLAEREHRRRVRRSVFI